MSTTSRTRSPEQSRLAPNRRWNRPASIAGRSPSRSSTTPTATASRSSSTTIAKWSASGVASLLPPPTAARCWRFPRRLLCSEGVERGELCCGPDGDEDVLGFDRRLRRRVGHELSVGPAERQDQRTRALANLRVAKACAGQPRRQGHRNL